MSTANKGVRYDDGYIRLFDSLGGEGLWIGNHGLLATMRFKSFMLSHHMEETVRTHPIGLLSGMVAMAHSAIWFNPNFIIRQAEVNPQTAILMLPFTYTVQPEFYHFLDCQLLFIDVKMGTVGLRSQIHYSIDVCHMSERTFTLHHKLYHRGVWLATAHMTFGLMHKTLRRMSALPYQLQHKSQYITARFKPDHINILTKPASNHLLILTRKTIVKKDNIDINGHSHMSTFISLALDMFMRTFCEGRHVVREFDTFIKRETHIGDELVCVCWIDEVKKEFYNQVVKGDNIVAFSRAVYDFKSKL